MSLSAREQQALDLIKDGLADSDPQLAALLTTFTQLASGEEMPLRDEIRSSSRRTIQHSHRQRRHPSQGELCWYARRVYQRLGLQHVMLLLWLLVTAALIAVALVLTHGGSQGTCTGSWATFCAPSTPASSTRPASPDRVANQASYPKMAYVHHSG
jgi:hypothetical protein